MLSTHGVTAMMTEYAEAQVSAVSFRMNVNGQPMGFKLPCNWRATREIFKRDPKIRGKFDSDEQAVKTSWRIIHAWVKAQLALVEVNMVTVPQVFLPYAIMKNGKTLSEHVATNPGFLLGQGEHAN